MQGERKKKVAIVGCSTHKDKAPFGNPEWEFWGVNNLFLHLPPNTFSRWFEIHPIIKDETGQFHRRANPNERGCFDFARDFRGQNVNEYIAGMAGLNIPVYMQRVWPEIPMSREYPLRDIVEKFGNYFTNSISYMIALAIMEGFTTIGIYGVDMAVATEYSHQRASCEYFIGLARGLGITIELPVESDLLKTRYLYGFQEVERDNFDKKLMHILGGIDKQLNEATNTKNHMNVKEQQAIGAKQAILEIRKIWM